MINLIQKISYVSYLISEVCLLFISNCIICNIILNINYSFLPYYKFPISKSKILQLV